MKNYNCYIGIDAGANGGIAMYDGGIHTIKMPKDLNILRKYIQHCIVVYDSVVVFLEKLSIQHRDFNEGGKVFRLQKMMENYAQLKAIISVCNVDWAEVHPLTWQSRLNLRIKGEFKPIRKARYKIEANKIYPALKPTLWNCDAVLIMHYGREMLSSNNKKDIKWLEEHLYKIQENDNILFN